jgi:hypothetical protein
MFNADRLHFWTRRSLSDPLQEAPAVGPGDFDRFVWSGPTRIPQRRRTSRLRNSAAATHRSANVRTATPISRASGSTRSMARSGPNALINAATKPMPTPYSAARAMLQGCASSSDLKSDRSIGSSASCTTHIVKNCSLSRAVIIVLAARVFAELRAIGDIFARTSYKKGWHRKTKMAGDAFALRRTSAPGGPVHHPLNSPANWQLDQWHRKSAAASGNRRETAGSGWPLG